MSLLFEGLLMSETNMRSHVSYHFDFDSLLPTSDTTTHASFSSLPDNPNYHARQRVQMCVLLMDAIASFDLLS